MKASTLFEIKNRLMKLAFSIPSLRAPAIKAKMAEISALIDEEVKKEKATLKKESVVVFEKENKEEQPVSEKKGRWAKHSLTKEEK